jgi:hypothetical protein
MVRRLILLAAGLSVVGALAGGLSAQASPGGNGAEVIREGGDCLASANSGGSWLFSCDFQIVFGPSGSITQYITGSVIPEESSPLPSRAITDVTGGPCLVLGGEVLTTVVAGVVTPSGHVQLICKN